VIAAVLTLATELALRQSLLVTSTAQIAHPDELTISRGSRPVVDCGASLVSHGSARHSRIALVEPISTHRTPSALVLHLQTPFDRLSGFDTDRVFGASTATRSHLAFGALAADRALRILAVLAASSALLSLRALRALTAHRI